MSLMRIDWNPDLKKLRQFGAGLLLLGVVAGGLLLRRGRPAGLVVLPVGLVLGTVVLAWPAAGRRIYKAWMAAAFVAGTIVSTAALAFIYYLVVTPLGLVLRACGRDALGRAKKSVPSYWTPLEAPADESYYERLF